MKLFTRVFCLIMLVVAGCVPSVPAGTQPADPFVAASATSPVVSKTPVVPTVVETVSISTAPSVLDVSLATECISVEDNLPEDLVLSGVWVRSQNKPYLENLDEHTKYEIPLKGGGRLDTYSADFSISPDGKHLAYIDSYLYVDSQFDSAFGFERRMVKTQGRILRIINSAGHALSMDFWIANWQAIIGWVDDQHLAVSVSSSISNKDVIILNPFTGSWKRFEAPQWVNIDDSYGWNLPYSPTLEKFWDSDRQHLVLKDVETGSTVWESDPEGGLPMWSSDGSTLAVISASFIDIIFGTDQQTKFDISESRLGSLYSWNVAIAPNGQKLFFANDSPEKFLFFDAKESRIYKLCPNDYEMTHVNRPFWSPENRYVVVNVQDSNYYYCYCDAYDPFDLLIDTQQMRAYKLPTRQYHERLAWLARP